MSFKIRRHFLLRMRRDAICRERPMTSSAVTVLEVTMATMATMVKASTVTTFPKVSPNGYKTLAPTCATYAAPWAPRRRKSRFYYFYLLQDL